MKYTGGYQITDDNDKGFSTREERIFINYAGYYEFDEPYGATYRQHGRKDYYLSYNHSGSMKIKSGGKIYEVDEGAIFIYRPFEEQYYGQANKQPISNYWVHFTGYAVNELLFKADLGEGNIFYTGVSHEFPVLFEAIINELAEKPYNFKYISASFLEQLLFVISRKLAYNSGEDVKKRDLRINNTVNFIHRNYSKNVTVNELASIAGLSPNRYSIAFKKLTGVSPQQYLINFRLQKAKELIGHTSLNIKQIASLAGFDNQLYFSRIFKKYENISPSGYMKRITSSS